MPRSASYSSIGMFATRRGSEASVAPSPASRATRSGPAGRGTQSSIAPSVVMPRSSSADGSMPKSAAVPNIISDCLYAFRS
eukprot:10779801-Heterocapsa_arctica.AAC.1